MTLYEELADTYQKEFTLDLPVEFNKLKIYPVRMKDYFDFLLAVSILKIKKNNIPDPKIISMSYLEFIISLMNKEDISGDLYKYMLYTLFNVCLQKEDVDIKYGKDADGKAFLLVDSVAITKKDFDKLKSIILIQNFPDYSDDEINPELEKELEEAEKIRAGKDKPCSLEKHLLALTMGTSMTMEEVKDLTVRKFKMAIEMMDKKLHYEIYKTASVSGFVEFKQDIKHYLVETKESIEDKVMDYNALKEKLSVHV